jgi:hypothetical protein
LTMLVKSGLGPRTHGKLSNPHIGTPLTEGGQARAFTMEGRWAWEMPTITVLYRIEVHYLTIESARFEDAQTGPIGNA